MAEKTTESNEFGVIRSRFSKLIEKILPEEISVDLYSHKIIDRTLYDLSFDKRVLRKDRTRLLMEAVLDATGKDKSVFNLFCSVLEKSEKPSVRELAANLRGDLEKIMVPHIISKMESVTKDVDLKELEYLRRSLLQSDENIDAKHSLIKEFISRFIKNAIETGKEKEQVQSSLEQICFVKMLVPPKLQDWCFQELEKIFSECINPSISPLQEPDSDACSTESLFTKDNVYHSVLLSSVVCTHNAQNYQTFFTKFPHGFDELSVSVNSQKEEFAIEQYIIALKHKTMFVAFHGESDLKEWHKYNSFNEGISTKKDCIPTRFFVEYLRKEEGHKVVLTGFSFGALLAMNVYSELWNQSCLGLNDLKASVACIGFGAPLVNLSEVTKILEDCPGMIENVHLLYLEDDIFPKLLQCVDFPVPKDSVQSDHAKKLYNGTICGDVVASLSQLQQYHSHFQKTSMESQKTMVSLKRVLKIALLSVQFKLTMYGSLYLIYRSQDTYVMTELTKQTIKDQLQYPSLSSIESLQADVFKKHSMMRYKTAIAESFLKSTDGEKYLLPSNLLIPKQISLKPQVHKARFFRHADEVALVLEGKNMWFCHRIKVGNRDGSKFINIDARGQDTAMRSLSFNYIPKDDGDLLIGPKGTTVDITLFSHFCKPIKQQNVSAEKIVDYAISFRQRQLASLTPTEVIRLSLLSAMLERPSPKFKTSNRPSQLFNTICQFLEDATRIVPVESICHAIENESEENAWMCAEALVESKFEPLPSFLFDVSLNQALLRLKTGIPHSILQRMHDRFTGNFQEEYDSEIFDGVALEETSTKRENDYVLDEEPHVPPLFSDVVKVHSTKSHKSLRKQYPAFNARGITHSGKHKKIITELHKKADHIRIAAIRKNGIFEVICGLNIEQLYPVKSTELSTKLKSPIDFLKSAKKKLLQLQQKIIEDSTMLLAESEDVINYATELHNEEMIKIVNEVMSQEVAICLSLLGAFMERQMRVPFVNSPEETAHRLQTIESSSAVGVWTLFSLDMMNLQTLLKSQHGKLVVEVEKYIEGILYQNSRGHSVNDRGRYAGKLQFLMLGMVKTVSCNTQYISYSLERQLSVLCKKYGITPKTRVHDVVSDWNKKFNKSILYHVMSEFRPLLARWLIWSLNIHKLRENLASYTTVGIVGLSKSGKSCLVRHLFDQEAVSGTTSMQRTTIPFLYNLEGMVDGLSIADFPGVDDRDKTVVEISKILLQLSQIVVLVIDYRRTSTQSAEKLLEQLDQSGVPLLLCLTHADKLFANECIRTYGEDCPDEIAKRIIGKELERLKMMLHPSPNRTTVFCSFYQDSDSFLNCEEGRKRLSKIGIHSQEYVGKWLVEKLGEYLQQPNVAEKLDMYLQGKNLDHTCSSPNVLTENPRLEDKAEGKKEMLENPRSVTVCGESSIAVTGKQLKFASITLKWPGYGWRLSIPPGALPDEATCTITVKLISDGKFEIPDDAEVVSAFYWIHSSYKFLKQVTLHLDHCAHIEKNFSDQRMSFIIGRCDQEVLPYKFKRFKGVFDLKSREASISVKSFSFFAIIRNWWSGCHDELKITNETFYAFKVFGKKSYSQKVWQFDFLFIKDREPYITTIDQKYLSDGWIEDNPSTSFEFKDDAIDIILPTGEGPEGWKIVKKCLKQIKKSYIDRSLESTTQQNYRIAFRWTGSGNPSPMECPVTIIGTTEPIVVKLILPIHEEGKSDAADVVLPQSRESPPLMINIENNPVIDVNVHAQS